MDEIEELLQQIERELANGKHPIFGGGVTVDAEAIYAAVDGIRAAIPGAVREAKIILRDSEKRMEAESNRARDIIKKAEQRANELLNEHALLKQAQEEADRIRRQADAYAAKVRMDARNELIGLLEQSDDALMKSLKLIRSALNNLK